MKKIKLIIIILLLSFSYSNAQIGINTNTPQRTLDINGNLRIRTTTNKNSDTSYDKVLVVNNIGETETWTKQAVKTELASLAVETKKVYFSNGPNPNTPVTCGKIQLRFSASTHPEIRRVGGNTAVTVYFSRIRMTATNNKNLVTNSNVTIPANNNWQRIDNTNSGGNYTLNTKDEYYLSYPGDENIYRITTLARTMSTSPDTNSYTILCEKF